MFDSSGLIRARYVLDSGSGFNAITITVSGEVDGEVVSESSKVFVQAGR